ncbi:MAG: DUF5615 family PIN-like protein [Armatimonadetes bacterium]|nr:DUF5615 family PIN-like protein [Armatimonadota bacterium]
MSGITDTEGLFIRLYLDGHIKSRLSVDLRANGFDVLTTQEAGKDTATDEEQLVFASSQNRAILTFNTCHFARLHRQWIASGRKHAGIIVSRQLGSREYGILLNRMLALLNQLSADQIRGTLVHLEQFRS